MGNNCVGSRVSKDCFFKSISHSIWWSRSSCDIFPHHTNREIKSVSKCVAKEAEADTSIQHQPPEQVKIVKDEIKASEPEKSKKVTEKKKESESTKHEEEAKTSVHKIQEKPKPAVPAKEKGPYNVKRLSSAGLQAGSVLQTKTGRLKQYYNLGRKLGNGQFGTTFLCVEKGTGKEYACKSIAKRKLITTEDVEDVGREIQIMHHLAGHSNAVLIEGAYEDSVAVHVVMELCAGGELFDRIIRKGHYTERKAAQLARTIVGFVETCHSLGFIHWDLKPENFLFVNEEEDSPLKAIDFGLSVFFKPGDIFTDVVGSTYYVAPEVLLKHHGPEADVWSCGVIICILLSGVPPFWGDPWPDISESAKDLVRKVLVKDPKRQLTAHEVLCHPWIQDDRGAPDKPLDSAVSSRLKQFSVMHKLKKMAIRVIAESLSEEEIAGLKEMFKMIDADNSVQVTFEELKVGLKRFGANLDESEIYDLMRAVFSFPSPTIQASYAGILQLQIKDVDNSGTMDYGEFIATTLHLNKAEKEDHLFAAFSYFDKDGSGYITADKLRQACEEFGIEDIRLEDLIREVDQDNDGRR